MAQHIYFAGKKCKFCGIIFEKNATHRGNFVERTTSDPQSAPSRGGIYTPVIHVPWTQPTQHSKHHHVTVKQYVSILQMALTDRLWTNKISHESDRNYWKISVECTKCYKLSQFAEFHGSYYFVESCLFCGLRRSHI